MTLQAQYDEALVKGDHKEAARIAREVYGNRKAYSESSREAKFIKAVQDGDVAAVEKFLSEGVSPNTLSMDGRTALMCAPKRKQPGVFEILLSHEKIRRDAVDSDGRTALWRVISNEVELEIVQSLTDDTTLRLPDCDGETPMMRAVWSGRTDLIKYFAQNGADPDQPNNQGETPLIRAIIRNRPDDVRALLVAEANPNLPDDNKQTPLMHAASKGRPDIVQILLEDWGTNPRDIQKNIQAALNAVLNAEASYISLDGQLRAVKLLSDNSPISRMPKMDELLGMRSEEFYKGYMGTAREIAAGKSVVADFCAMEIYVQALEQRAQRSPCSREDAILSNSVKNPRQRELEEHKQFGSMMGSLSSLRAIANRVNQDIPDSRTELVFGLPETKPVSLKQDAKLRPEDMLGPQFRRSGGSMRL